LSQSAEKWCWFCLCENNFKETTIEYILFAGMTDEKSKNIPVKFGNEIRTRNFGEWKEELWKKIKIGNKIIIIRSFLKSSFCELCVC
jgi:hypothetical protein